jgi:hypothetical protein
VLDDEYGQHDCPYCGYSPNDDTVDEDETTDTEEETDERE